MGWRVDMGLHFGSRKIVKTWQQSGNNWKCKLFAHKIAVLATFTRKGSQVRTLQRAPFGFIEFSL
jgi:hypothetical protein